MQRAIRDVLDDSTKTLNRDAAVLGQFPQYRRAILVPISAIGCEMAYLDSNISALQASQEQKQVEGVVSDFG